MVPPPVRHAPTAGPRPPLTAVQTVIAVSEPSDLTSSSARHQFRHAVPHMCVHLTGLGLMVHSASRCCCSIISMELLFCGCLGSTSWRMILLQCAQGEAMEAQPVPAQSALLAGPPRTPALLLTLSAQVNLPGDTFRPTGAQQTYLCASVCAHPCGARCTCTAAPPAPIVVCDTVQQAAHILQGPTPCSDTLVLVFCCPAVCDVGYFGNGGALNADPGCTACPPGTTTAAAGSADNTACTICAKGWFLNSNLDTPACAKCAVGSYKATDSNTDTCTACPTGKTTTTDGQVALAGCNSEWLWTCFVGRNGRVWQATAGSLHVHCGHQVCTCLVW